jgi:hypothetical protein
VPGLLALGVWYADTLGVVLWAFCEPLVSAKHESTEQYLAETLNNVLNDVRRLVALAEANGTSSSK